MQTRLYICLAVALIAAVPGAGQTGTGSMQGIVKDATGAVIPAAKVRAVHVQTTRSLETATNEIGLFLIPAAPIGSYSLKVEAAGMQAWEAEIVLQVGQTAVVNPVLKVGATATEITVAGDLTSLVTQESATIGQVLERSRIEQLPLNGRFFSTLVGMTTPGIEGLRPYGLREAALEFVQDGAVLTNRDTGSLSGRPPGIDSIEEFKVETNNSSARMNRPATTIISTRSGTNDLHGAAFETMRNNAFGIARRRQDYYDKAPHLVRNEFGASLGGPVYIPKVYNGRNRTFFFFAYEAYRSMSSSTSGTTLPTAAMRNGDFSGLIDGVGRRITLYDPWTTDGKTWQRQPFPSNQVPTARQSPLAKYLYSVTPLPTLPDTNPLVSNNYFGTSPNNRRDYTLTTRIDHQFSERDRVFWRYSHGKRTAGYRASNAAPTTLDGSTNITFNPIHDESVVATWNHTFSPTFFSETVGSLSYENFDVYTGTYYQDHAGRLGLPNPFNEQGFPTIGSTGFGMDYTQADTRRNNKTWVTSIDQNFTKVAGRHQLQFGGRFRNERMHVLPDQQFVSGNHSFSSGATSLYDPTSGTTYSATPRTGHDSANLFLGIAGSYAAQFVQKMYRFRDREYAAYLQDNIRLTARLTVNLGLRYEYKPPLHERDKLFTGFDRASKSVVNGLPLDSLYRLGRTTPEIVANFTRIGAKFLTPDQVGMPADMIYPNRLDFGPRAGFAYRLPGQRATVLRGGYALYSYPPPLRNFDASTRSNPPFNANFTQSFTSAAQSPDGLPNWQLRNAPVVIAGVNSKNVIDPTRPGGVTRGGFSIAYFDPHQPSTRVHEYNLTFERDIMESTVVRAAFVGNRGYNLEQFYRFNEAPSSYIWFVTTGQPAPTGEYAGVARRGFDQTTYGNIMMFGKTGWSNYNGVQLEIQRRFVKGCAFQMFYVMGNAFRVAGNGWRDDIVQDPNMFLPGAVPADFDARNRFLNYRRDTDLPKHRLRWNWLIDLPAGKGKPLGRNAGRFLDRLIGGWQLAGFGSIRSTYWALPTGNWGPSGKVEIYGRKYPIQDCRSGRCIPGYLYYNGYIPANRINSYDAQGRPNGVMGVPDNYQPAHKPIIPIPKDGGSPSDPLYQFYDSNNVWVTLKNGTVQRVGYDDNLHPWRNQFMPGVRGFGLDASVFKNTRITERFVLRFTADFFNVLNMPGTNQPSNSSGIISMQTSANEPRQMQLTMRLTW